MKPSSSPSTLLSSASKSPSVSFFDFEGTFHSMFNCGYSDACSSAASSSDAEDADRSSLPTTNTRTTIYHHQASYDADGSDLEEDNTESARDYFERISKLAAKKNEERQEEPTTTTVTSTTTTTPKKSSIDVVVVSSTTTATTTTSKSKNKNKKHYEIFQFVKPTPKYGSYLKLKRTDSDSTRRSRSRSTSIRPHLSPILVPITSTSSGPGGFVVMQYDGNNNNNNNNMSHKDSELRRLERRAQQQQYQQCKHRHANSDILLTKGFYVFR